MFKSSPKTLCSYIAQRETTSNRSSLSLSDQGGNGLWNVASRRQEDYWKGYLSTRPTYGKDFYQAIYNYHSRHSVSPSYFLAHDVGAGPGHVSRKLASKFSHVVVSDKDRNVVDYTRRNLSPTGSATKPSSSPSSSSQFSYIVSKGEDLWQMAPPESADLIVCSLMFPLMETSNAMDCFRRLLKPNGTLAIWFYGRAHFAEPEYLSTCQPLLDRIINHHFSRVIQAQGREGSEQWKHTANRIASWLDYIPFDKRHWYGVERRKWNRTWAEMGFFGREACHFSIQPEVHPLRFSAVEGDTVIELDDRNLWRKNWTVAEVRQFVRFIFPFPFSFDLHDKVLEAVWSDLEQEMGGRETRRVFSWPAVLVLAARK